MQKVVGCLEGSEKWNLTEMLLQRFVLQQEPQQQQQLLLLLLLLLRLLLLLLLRVGVRGCTPAVSAFVLKTKTILHSQL